MCALQPGRKHLHIQHTQGVNMQTVLLGRSPAPFISNKSVHSFLQSTTAFTAKHISPTSNRRFFYVRSYAHADMQCPCSVPS